MFCGLLFREDLVTTIDDVPAFLRFNQFILRGYRKSTSVSGCCRSLCYLHNEWSNIWLHTIGFFLFCWKTYSLWTWPGEGMTSGDNLYLVWMVNLVNLMFVASIIYHTLMPICKTKQEYELLMKFDVVCAIIGMTSSSHSFITMGYRCSPEWISRSLFVTLILFSSYTMKICLFSHNNRERAISLGIFMALRFVFGITSSFPRMVYQGLTPGISYHVWSLALVLCGGYINAKRFPELLFPGRFDFGIHSHGWWHLLGLAAGILGVWAIEHDVIEWNATVCRTEEHLLSPI